MILIEGDKVVNRCFSYLQIRNICESALQEGRPHFVLGASNAAEILKALNESMSSLVDKALRRAIALYDRPHLATLVDSIVTLALRIEQEGVNVASDPDASRQFHDGIAKILETTIAAPSEESEDVKVHAWIDAEAAMSLVRAGVDWSRGRK